MPLNVTFQPENKQIEVGSGITILQAAIKARIPIRYKCGGKGSCLTCKVHIEDVNSVSEPTSSEKQKLGIDITDNRLACQTKILNSTTVTIPEDPLKAAIRRQLSKKNNNSIWDD